LGLRISRWEGVMEETRVVGRAVMRLRRVVKTKRNLMRSFILKIKGLWR
jgi:hypothetical protein